MKYWERPSDRKRQLRHVRPRGELESAIGLLYALRKQVLRLRSQILGPKTSGKEWDVLRTIDSAIKIAEFARTDRAVDAIEAADLVDQWLHVVFCQVDELLYSLDMRGGG